MTFLFLWLLTKYNNLCYFRILYQKGGAMMIDSSDLANLKEAIRDLKNVTKLNIEITKAYKLSLDMNNLLMLFNLGLISQDDLI